MRWDPEQYGRYADERGRPFLDLVERIGADHPRRVADLGCGPGPLTTLLADRWPQAVIEGIDSSPEMIAKAEGLGDARIAFRLCEIGTWSPGPDVDVVVSNAALQWVPGHESLLARWLHLLPSGAWLAWQVPGNFGSPSHRLMRELAESSTWADRVGDALRHHDSVRSPDTYARLLLTSGWSADVWETTYLHVLEGTDPVLEWVRGTGLRPVLAALDAYEPTGRASAEFEVEYAAALRAAYPATEHGTVFEFRRIFAVGCKP